MATRYQIDFSDELNDQLELWGRNFGMKKKEIINNALTMLEWAIDEVESERRIASVDAEGNYETITMPILRQAAKQARTALAVSG